MRIKRGKEERQMEHTLTLRAAEEKDVGVVLSLIRELAEYEKMSDQVIATEEGLRAAMFDRRVAEAIIAEEDGKPIGFALYFYNFSTFIGHEGLYLEDLYVRPEYRGRGYGKALFCALARRAKEKNCGRFEWSCLDWNTPSIGFYRSMGAVAMDEWTVYRLDRAGIDALVQN